MMRLSVSMVPSSMCRASFAVVALAAASTAFAQQTTLPSFRSSVELTSIDVGVSDERGNPIIDLTAADFSVRVDGTARRVVSAEWVPLETPAGGEVAPVPEGYSSNETATGGRLIVIVVDQPNIRFGGTAAIRKALNAFIDRLETSDRAAVLGIGSAWASTNFTSDRARLKKAVERMTGMYRETDTFLHAMSLQEALDIRRDVPRTLGNVLDRECQEGGRTLSGPELDVCTFEIQRQAFEVATNSTVDGRQTMDALRGLLRTLRSIEAPKTIVLVTEGFVIDDQQATVLELGALSAAARTTIYGLKLDEQLMTTSAAEVHAPIGVIGDRALRSEGLELLVHASRGMLFNIVGTGAGVFERLRMELSGYYLLGLESSPTDRDGKSHGIRVEVSRKPATVHARRALLALQDKRGPQSARQMVAAALANPLPLAALPLRVSTYSLQGPEVRKVQLLIHADVGRDYSASRSVSIGYVITDSEGRSVESQTASARLPPVMNGVPSALQFSGGASLSPGDYIIKLAVAEGDRVGTVEHAFRAGVQAAGPVRVSDLMVGGPLSVTELLQPTVGHRVTFGAVHGYVEAYGTEASALKAKYEIVSNAEAEAILEAEVDPHMAGDARAIFSRVLPARQLPPGGYVLRVTLSSGRDKVAIATRAFEVGAPAVLMTSASAPSSGIMPRSEVYLPVPDQLLSRAFDRSEVSTPETLRAFRDRVPAASLAAFDTGVQALSAGKYADAEKSFKSAINPDVDSSAAIAYLAAVFAAAGRDDEAAGAWQTALIDGTEFPQIYEWLAGALLRSRDLAPARSMLEEAIAKWPSDTRFARPMALIYAMFGQGEQAIRLIERYLAEQKEDVEALGMAVEWIYQLRVAGVSAHSPDEDRKLARAYADRYAKAKGPQGRLVRQWMEFLDRK
jgi:VWFA-related protein